eukprot:m.216962 g.216962  ORF g.216962 m.216962 type:complete len:496 (-) comp33221_c0_seq2:318-1805(-)
MRNTQPQQQRRPKSFVAGLDAGVSYLDASSETISLEAPFTLSLFFALFGMVFAFGYTYWAYHTNEDYYFGNVTAPRKFAPEVSWLSPFATGSNFAYMAGGVGIFGMKLVLGSQHFPSHGYLAGLLITLLGIGSFVFHQSGDKTLDDDQRTKHNGDWQHRCDVIFMFLMFGALAIFALNSWVHACRGKKKESNVLVFFTTLVMVVLSVVSFVSLQVNYSAAIFLVLCGGVAIISMWCAMGLLAARREAHVAKHKKEIFETDIERDVYGDSDDDSDADDEHYKAQCVCCKRVWWIGMFKAVPQPLTGLIALAVGRFALNDASEVDRDFVRMWQPTMNLTEEGDHFREVRKQYDYKHGSWHFLTAIVILGVIFNIIQGLSGRMHHPLWKTRVGNHWKHNVGETMSAVYTVVISLVLLITQQVNPPSEDWLKVWGVIIFIGLPLSGYALVLAVRQSKQRKKTREHHRRIHVRRASEISETPFGGSVGARAHVNHPVFGV